jgi:demethylmenaquinone methyltransferase/2-methoxy-6-polyprenyl-1,4-benzoquinol methylase
MCPDCEVLGVDFSEPMLAKARARGDSSNLRFWAGNVCHLVQLDDGSCQRVIVGFGLRNVADFRSALAELWRVTKRGGRIVILDLSQPRGLWGRASSWYRYRLVPWLGKAVAGDGEAYTYLPNSVDSYLDQEQLRSLMELVGWREVRYQNLLGGILAIHSGLK